MTARRRLTARALVLVAWAVPLTVIATTVVATPAAQRLTLTVGVALGFLFASAVRVGDLLAALLRVPSSSSLRRLLRAGGATVETEPPGPCSCGHPLKIVGGGWNELAGRNLAAYRCSGLPSHAWREEAHVLLAEVSLERWPEGDRRLAREAEPRHPVMLTRGGR